MLFHIDAKIILFNENDYVTIDTANSLYFLFISLWQMKAKVMHYSDVLVENWWQHIKLFFNIGKIYSVMHKILTQPKHVISALSSILFSPLDGILYLKYRHAILQSSEKKRIWTMVKKGVCCLFLLFFHFDSVQRVFWKRLFSFCTTVAYIRLIELFWITEFENSLVNYYRIRIVYYTITDV